MEDITYNKALWKTDILKFSFKKLHFPLGLKQYSQDHLLLDKKYIWKFLQTPFPKHPWYMALFHKSTLHITLSPANPLVPGTWSHHTICTGLARTTAAISTSPPLPNEGTAHLLILKSSVKS